MTILKIASIHDDIEHLIEMQGGVYEEMWQKVITQLQEVYKIDCLAESKRLKIMTESPYGASVLFVDEQPFCEWSSLKISTGLSDETNTMVRAEIFLKFYTYE